MTPCEYAEKIFHEMSENGFTVSEAQKVLSELNVLILRFRIEAERRIKITAGTLDSHSFLEGEDTERTP